MTYPGNLQTLVLCAAILLYAPASIAAKKPPPSNIDQLWKIYQDSKKPGLTKDKFPFQSCFEQAASTHNLPLTLLLAVARGESDFDPETISKANARGVMQILWPGTAKDLGFERIEQLHVPCPNIKAGSRYLRGLVDRYKGDYHLALAAYNYGPGRIKSHATMPDGAKWYSGYIYNHLQFVLSKAQSPQEPAYNNSFKILLTYFSRPYQAEGYVNHLSNELPEFRFDWFKSKKNVGDFDAVLVYRDAAEKTRALARLRAEGYIR